MTPYRLLVSLYTAVLCLGACQRDSATTHEPVNPEPVAENELIIIYHENVRDTGHTLAEISKDGDVLPEYAAIGEALTKRSLSSFSVIEE